MKIGNVLAETILCGRMEYNEFCEFTGNSQSKRARAKHEFCKTVAALNSEVSDETLIGLAMGLA